MATHLGDAAGLHEYATLYTDSNIARTWLMFAKGLTFKQKVDAYFNKYPGAALQHVAALYIYICVPQLTWARF